MKFTTNAVIIIIPLALLLVFPFVGTDYTIYVLTISFYYIILAASWNLVAGYTGIFSLAHTAFAGVGAYTMGILAAQFSVPPLIGILMGGIVALCCSYVIGKLTLHLSGTYLALATWAFAGSFATFVYMEYDWTRGAMGLNTPYLFGQVPGAAPLPYYFFFASMAIVVLYVIYKVVNSKVGLFIVSIREDETAAAVCGVDTAKWKLYIFCLSGLIAGIAGGFYATLVGLISPVLLEFDEMAFVIMMVTMGGWGTFLGPILGAPLIEGLTEVLRLSGGIRLVLFASLVIILMRYNRGGLVELLSRLRLLVKRSALSST